MHPVYASGVLVDDCQVHDGDFIHLSTTSCSSITETGKIATHLCLPIASTTSANTGSIR